jgi:LPS sulfotransferase NodH
MPAGLEAPLFFVFGAPRSGTTWLQKAIDAHPELTCLGEGKFLFMQRELAKACAQYSAFLDHYNRTMFGESFFAPIEGEEFKALYRRLIEIRIRTHGDPGARRVGAKDPEHGTNLDFLTAAFPDAAYIHLVRDPRDVAVSMWSHLQRTDPPVAASYGSLERFAAAHGRDWAGYQGAVRAARTPGLDFHELRYEQLQTEPADTLAGVFAALGVGASPALVETCLQAASFERSSGGRARGEEDAASFYRQGLVGDWRGRLTADAAAAVLAATDGLAGELGYD